MTDTNKGAQPNIHGIHDPEIAYVVTIDNGNVVLTMHFQDDKNPENAARVAVQMAPAEALEMADDLTAAAHGAAL